MLAASFCDELSAMSQTAARPAPLFLIFGLIALATLARGLPYLIPELGNFTPVAAVALFAGCYLSDRRTALLVPLVAMLISDLLIGFHSLMPIVYGCMAATAYFGAHLRNKVTPGRTLAFALGSSLLFFVATNVAVWAQGTMYPLNAAGFVQCFVMALPFWRNELVGTLLWTAVLFGGYALLHQRARAVALA